MNKVIIFLIHLYRYTISSFLKSNCRYMPSCSCYAQECFREFSFFKALWYSVSRILRCHPFSSGGYDPVIPQRDIE